MKLLRRCSPLVLSAGLVALAAPADQVSFHPEEGKELTKVFESRMSLGLEDLLIEVNGEEMDPSMMGMDFDLDSATLEGKISVEVADTYVKMGDNRPLELLRNFVELAGEFETGFGESKSSEDEDLVGHTVRFKWDDEAGEYVASYEGEGGDEDQLAKLSEDMDLRALLPSGAVSEGDSWRVAWADNLSLVMPGFDVGSLGDLVAEQAAEDEDFPAEAFDSVMEQFREIFADASATCTYRGTREVDGKQLGVIGIESEIIGDIDMVSIIEEAIAASGEEMPEGAGFDDFTFDVSVDLVGELLWDSAAGHVHSMELEGDLNGTVNVEMNVAEQGMEFSLAASVEISGDLGRTVTTR